MKKRRASRECALQVLYAMDIHRNLPSLEPDTLIPAAAEQLKWIGAGAPKGAGDLAYLLVSGVLNHLTDIDRYIETASENWAIHRLSVIDRNILRIAVFEIAYVPDLPPRVAINEAIEIAKSFGTDHSPKFINGVLDRIYRILRIKSRGNAGQTE